MLSVEPAAGLVAVAVWAAYAFPLIWLINRFDFFERESSFVIAGALAWGGVIASTMAVTANQAFFSLLTSAFGADVQRRMGPRPRCPDHGGGAQSDRDRWRLRCWPAAGSAAPSTAS